MKRYIGIIVLGFYALTARTQSTSFRSPFDFQLKLSANFAELRPNHFHGGLDIKTEGRSGQEVHSVADGYVSRINISYTGYGNALYIRHKNGYTTVYGHLQNYAPKLRAFIERYQYQHETWEMDVDLQPDDLPVYAGEVVAYSGNTGASMGPHLHFELRNSKTDECTDPLAFFSDYIADTREPKATQIKVYPQTGKGIANGQVSPQIYSITRLYDDENGVRDTIRAWGEVGFAIRANDYMNGVENHFGIRSIRLLADDKELYKSDLGRFSWDENRMIYAWTDIEDAKINGRWFMKSFLVPGNTLRFMQADSNRGLLCVNEERAYRMRYILTDFYGNESQYSFVVKGEKREIPSYFVDARRTLHCNTANVVQLPGFELDVPRGNIYDDLQVDPYVAGDSSSVANNYHVYHYAYPIHDYCPIMINVRHDYMADKSKYYIVNKVGSRYVGGTYEDGWMKGKVRELGTYTVLTDTDAPVITPIDKGSWARTGIIVLKISDGGSGIKTYKGRIDGKFALFSSSLSRTLTCKWKDLPFDLDGKYTLEMEAIDRCGNRAVYSTEFDTNAIQRRKVAPKRTRAKAKAKAKRRRR